MEVDAFQLLVTFLGDVHIDLRQEVDPVARFPVEKRHLLRTRFLARLLVAPGQRKEHLADEFRRHGMVGGFVFRIMREDHVRIRPAHRVQNLRTGLVRIEKTLVVVAHETHLRIVKRRRLEHLGFARALDLLDVGHHVRTGVAARRERDVDLVSLLLVLEQCSADIQLDVVRMCTDCQNVHLSFPFN